MTTQTPAGAIAWMRNQRDTGARGWNNLCLRACRTAWRLPGGWPDSNAAWRAVPANHRHRWSNNPPLGSAVFWDVGAHGHICLSDGHGNVWGTSLPQFDRIGLVPIGEVRRRWGARELGWASWLNGSALPLTTAGQPPAGGRPPTTGGTPMATPEQIAQAVWDRQLPSHDGRQTLRARTYLVRGTGQAVWDEAVPDTYGNGVDQTSRRTLRDVARAVAGSAGGRAMLMDDETTRTLTDADVDALAIRVAAYMAPQDHEGPVPAE